MNEMELLRELAQQTPLPAPAELGAARARLVAAITTDPATYATAVAEVTTDQPDVPPASRPGCCGLPRPRRCGPQPGSCTGAPSAPPRC